MDVTEKIKEDIRKRRSKAPKKAVSPYKQDTGNIEGLSIAQRYYDTVRQPVQKQPDRSIDYKGIEDVVREINLVQREFEKMKQRDDAKGIQSLVLKSYDSIMKISGRENKYYSGIELFEKQISNVSSLNQLLGAMVINSGRELEVVKSRVNTLISESENYHNRLGKLEKELPALIGSLKEAKEKFVIMKPSDEKYFSMERNVVDLERGVDESYAEYNMLKENYLGISRHKENQIYMESLFRISLKNAANLTVITKQIGETLVDNQKILSQCRNLVHATAAVSGGLDILSDYNTQLNERFIGGVREMQDIISSNKNVVMIADTNYNLREMIQYVRSIGHRQDMLTDNLIKE